MKKAFLTLATSVAAVGSSYAQGYVSFNNFAVTTPVLVNSFTSPSTFTPIAITATPIYYFALFYSTSPTATFDGSTAGVVGGAPNTTGVSSFVIGSAAWTQDPGILGVNNSGGHSGGGFVDSNPNNVANGTPVPAGSVDSFIVFGWSANIGSTVASVESYLNGTDGGVVVGFIGQSPVGVVTLSPGGITPINNLFDSFTPGDKSITGFSLGFFVDIPEPTTIALGVLGGLSWLALRRMKT